MNPWEALTYPVVHACQVWLPQTQTWLYGLVKHLPARIENHIVAAEAENPDQFSVANLSVGAELQNPLRRIQRRIGGWPEIGAASEVVRRVRPRVVHAHFGPAGWVALDAARGRQTALVTSFYGLDVDYVPQADSRWKKRYRDLFVAADRILCLGPDMAERLEARGCPPGKLQIHHLGIDVDSLPYVPRAWSPGRPLRCLIAASFREKKGIPVAIEALGRLSQTIPIELTIIGDATADARSQQEKARIRATIDSSGLTRVNLLGYVSHALVLRSAYEHDVFLAPSRTASDGDREGTPMTIIEMAATGMPVVSTCHADIPELIEDGSSGLLAREGNVDDLVDRMRWLAANPDSWESIVSAARAHVELSFAAPVQGVRLARIYDEVGVGR